MIQAPSTIKFIHPINEQIIIKLITDGKLYIFI